MKPLIGDIAPDFTASVTDGKNESELTLSLLRGQKVVLVFYPKDNTPGCTIQACSLSNHWDEIKAHAKVFGVSTDCLSSHEKFILKRKLPYSLIADTDRSICEAYGVWVKKSFMGKTFMGVERSTFIIDPAGRIQAILEKVSPAKHTEILLKNLK